MNVSKWPRRYVLFRVAECAPQTPRFTAEKLRPPFSAGALRKKEEGRNTERELIGERERERERERKRSTEEGNAVFVNVSSAFRQHFPVSRSRKCKQGEKTASKRLSIRLNRFLFLKFRASRSNKAQGRDRDFVTTSAETENTVSFPFNCITKDAVFIDLSIVPLLGLAILASIIDYVFFPSIIHSSIPPERIHRCQSRGKDFVHRSTKESAPISRNAKSSISDTRIMSFGRHIAIATNRFPSDPIALRNR